LYGQWPDMFHDDESWFKLGASQPFPVGDLTASQSFNDNMFPDMVLDMIEYASNDAMVFETDGKEEPENKGLRSLPGRFYENGAVDAEVKVEAIPVDIDTTRHSSRPQQPATTLLSFASDESYEHGEQRARKRPRVEIDAPNPATIKSVKSVADQLSNLDSETFEDYCARLSAVRKLSSADLNEIKKIKRRIHNRESARKSRAEKRDHTDVLDQQVKALTDQLHATKLEMASLQAQNASLRNEIAFSYRLISESPVLSSLYAELKAKHEARRIGHQ